MNRIRIAVQAGRNRQHGPTLVSGGQTGVDRGALDAAMRAGAPCGGWCPHGRRAEDGPIPPAYPLTCLSGPGYRQRTRANVRDSDATLILTRGAPAGGTALTWQFAHQLQRPVLVIDANVLEPVDAGARAADWVTAHAIDVLNVAGPRASSWPGGAAYADAAVTAPLCHVLSIRHSA